MHPLHSSPGALRRFAAACCIYLLLASGLCLAWLMSTGVAPSLLLWAALAFASLTGLALACGNTAAARQYVLNLVAATLALPVLLLAMVVSLEPVPAAPPEARLDAERLFAGATLVQDADLRAAGIELMRSASFDDRSELRLMRFHDAASAAYYLATMAPALNGEPFTEAGRRGQRLRAAGIGDTFILMEQHGIDLIELRARDVAGGLARLAQQQVPAVTVAASASAGQPSPIWPVFTAAAIGHALVFVALILWGASLTTRVPAAAGVTPATAQALRSRLHWLNGPHTLIESVPGSLVFDVPAGPRRTHRITLLLDDRHHEVGVREVLGVHGDAPADADEASMRGAAEPAFEPARPQARRLWSRTRQTTVIEAARLAAVPLQLTPGGARLPEAHADGLDGEGVLTVLCALVTRSGWHWQPRLIGG
jgi:hypothetical protein